MPLVQRCAIIGAVAAGILGGFVGLVVGLRTNPATAWFAVFEAGGPAFIAGAVLGAAVGLLAVVVAKIIRP
jgi:hypothetical protein